MRRIAVALFAAALMPVTAQAQVWATPRVCRVDAAVEASDAYNPEGRKHFEAIARQEANPIGKLWRITSAKGGVSHLWGTIHSSDRIALKIAHDALGDILSDARLVAIEFDPRLRSRRAITDAVNYVGWMEDDFNLLPFPIFPGANPEIERWIRSRTEALGFGQDAPDFMTPGGLLLLLMSDHCEDFAAGALPFQDNFILTLARITGTPVTGMEGRDAVLEDLGATDRADLARALITLHGAYLRPTQDNSDRATSFALYARGELALWMAWSDAYLRTELGPRADEAIALANGYMLDERNRRFLASARSELLRGGVVMAVGAPHLPGDSGLVEILRAEGFSVERVVVHGEVTK